MPQWIELEQRLLQLIGRGVSSKEAVALIAEDPRTSSLITLQAYSFIEYFYQQLTAKTQAYLEQQQRTRTPPTPKIEIFAPLPSHLLMVPEYIEGTFRPADSSPFPLEKEPTLMESAEYIFKTTLASYLHQSPSFGFLIEEAISTRQLTAQSLDAMANLNVEHYIPPADLVDSSPKDSARQMNIQLTDFYKQMEWCIRTGIKGKELMNWIQEVITMLSDAPISAIGRAGKRD